MILTDKQVEGLRIVRQKFLNHEKRAVIAGYAGTGKAQPNDTVIPTPNGYKKLGDLKVGDYVYNRHGKPVKITGVFPQGQKEVFKVTLGDGRSSLCNDEHIWSTYTRQGNLVNHTLKELMRMGFKSNKTYKFKIPNMEAIDFPEQKLEIDPYVIGAFLGDGCCKETYLTLSSENDEIPNIICSLTNFKVKRSSEANYNWSFYLPYEQKVRGEIRTRPQTAEFLPKEVAQDAENKKIPQKYKYSSKEQRYDLLQGLLDTDGSITQADGRYAVRFTSISYQLILDVKEVLNSLGYQSIIVTKDIRPDKYVNGICYNLDINIPNEDKPKLFRLKRKHDIALKASEKPKKRDYNKVSIYSAEDLGYTTDMTCIMVDDPEHLYVTNDFIVTHNTTLVNAIIENLPGIKAEEDVCFAAYTGKACQVLKDKGNKEVSTLHRLLFESKPKSDGTFLRKRKTSIPYKVVVVDEASMVTQEFVSLLEWHHVFVIYLGDPQQLPPVDKAAANHLLDNPDVMLTEIMRQEAESDIIKLSMDIRQGNSIDYFKGRDAMVLPRNELNTGMMKWADIILCATNRTRIGLNNQMRTLLGHEGNVSDGEKLIALRNYWDDLDDNDDPIINGTIGYIKDPFESFVHYPPFLHNGSDIKVIYGNFISEVGGDYGMLCMDKQNILTGEYSLNPKEKYKIGSNDKFAPTLPKEFTYGYAVTTWKAQGSEWGKVLIIEEKFPFTADEHRRFLYTAVTRASEKVVLIRI